MRRWCRACSAHISSLLDPKPDVVLVTAADEMKMTGKHKMLEADRMLVRIPYTR